MTLPEREVALRARADAGSRSCRTSSTAQRRARLGPRPRRPSGRRGWPRTRRRSAAPRACRARRAFVVADPLVDDARLVGHVELAALGADLDRVAERALAAVGPVLGRAGRVVELPAVLRRVARASAISSPSSFMRASSGARPSVCWPGGRSTSAATLCSVISIVTLCACDQCQTACVSGSDHWLGAAVALRVRVGRCAPAPPQPKP